MTSSRCCTVSGRISRWLCTSGACSNLPDPPIRAGQHMIVFAFVSQWQSQVYGDLNLLVAPEQMAHSGPGSALELFTFRVGEQNREGN